MTSACFSPSTASCVYQCSAANNACPAGLSCFAGMCMATADEVCSAPGDDGGGGGDGDSTTAGCGDGIRGDLCFRAPFEVTVESTTSTGPTDVRFLDATGDGRADLIWVDGGGFKIHVQGMDGTLAVASTVGPNMTGIRLALVNAGSTNAVFAASETEVGLWAYNAAATTLARGGMATVPNGSVSPAAIDVGHVTGPDGVDVAVRYADTIVTYRFDMNGGGLAHAPSAIPIGDTLAIADINNDGLEEILYSDGPGLRLLRGAMIQPAQTLGNPMPTSVTVADRVAVGDMDGDGREDVVVTTANGVIGVALVNGSTYDVSMPVTQTVAPIDSLAVADVDADGKRDVLVGVSSPRQLLILRGNGDGTLQAPIEIPLEFPPRLIRADVDYNGDGVNDIIVSGMRRIAVLTSDP